VIRPVVVSAPPSVVSPVPSKLSVGFVVTFPRVKAVVLADPATIVEPKRVRVPGVVAEPIVLIDDAPDPNVLVSVAPVPMVDAPDEVRVVKEPALVPPVISEMKATVPDAFLNVIVFVVVGSVIAKIVLFASTVTPSNDRGEAPTIFAPVRFTLPVAVKPASVPTEVRDDPVTVEFKVVPVRVPAAAVIVFVIP